MQRGNNLNLSPEIIQLHAQAAEGDVDAMLSLAEFYKENFLEDKAANWYFKVASNSQAYEEDKLTAAQALSRLSNNGNISATNKLGVCYARGLGVKQDPEAAAICFANISASSADASYNRALTYEFGNRSTKPDLNLALECYENACKLGSKKAFDRIAKLAATDSPLALLTLADCYATAAGCKKNISAANQTIEHLQKLAEACHVEALHLLTECYYSGKNKAIKKDVEQTIECCDFIVHQSSMPIRYKERAIAILTELSNDHPQAEFLLAECFEKGLGVTQNDVNAFEYYQSLAENGHPSAMYKMGNIYAKRLLGKSFDLEKVIGWYFKTAKLDIPGADSPSALAAKEIINRAQHATKGFPILAAGECYAKGFGVDIDYEQVRKFYKLLVDVAKRYDQAKFELAKAYFDGHVVTGKDDDEAAQLFFELLKSPRHNVSLVLDGTGMTHVNVVHETTANDPSTYIAYLEKLADRKCARAQFYLGKRFELGLGCVNNIDKARENYLAAAALNSDEAGCSLAKLELNEFEKHQSEKDGIKYLMAAVKALKIAVKINSNNELGSKLAFEMLMNLAKKHRDIQIVRNTVPWCLKEGYGVEKNLALATQLYGEYATIDWPRVNCIAKYEYARALQQGIGIEKNLNLAVKFYSQIINLPILAPRDASDVEEWEQETECKTLALEGINQILIENPTHVPALRFLAEYKSPSNKSESNRLLSHAAEILYNQMADQKIAACDMPASINELEAILDKLPTRNTAIWQLRQDYIRAYKNRVFKFLKEFSDELYAEQWTKYYFLLGEAEGDPAGIIAIKELLPAGYHVCDLIIFTKIQQILTEKIADPSQDKYKTAKTLRFYTDQLTKCNALLFNVTELKQDVEKLSQQRIELKQFLEAKKVTTTVDATHAELAPVPNQEAPVSLYPDPIYSEADKAKHLADSSELVGRLIAQGFTANQQPPKYSDILREDYMQGAILAEIGFMPHPAKRLTNNNYLLKKTAPPSTAAPLIDLDIPKQTSEPGIYSTADFAALFPSVPTTVPTTVPIAVPKNNLPPIRSSLQKLTS